MKLGVRLLATYLIVSTLGIVALGVHDLWAFDDFFRTSSQADLAGRTAALAETVADAVRARDRRQLERLARQSALQEGITTRVIGLDGQLMASSQPELDRSLQDWRGVPGVTEGLSGRLSSGTSRGIFVQGDRLYVARPIYGPTGVVAVLRMAVTLEHFHQQLRQRWYTLLGAVSATFLLCTLASLMLARQLAVPIRQMRDFAVRVGSGRFDTPLEVRRRDELGELSDELRRMGQRLGSLDAERRAFLASVSHELRTPITNVLATLEALQDGAGEEPELRERFTQSALDEADRLRKLIQDLLELGRWEAGTVRLEPREMPLQWLVKRTLDALDCRFQAEGVHVVSTVTDVKVDGDPERLTQVLLNILDNAIRHAPRGSTIHVTAEARRDSAVISVRDEGSGIEPAHLPHIFEPFFIGDPSRKGSGTGLGLTIARRIAEAHGGTLTAESLPGKGATFLLCLPLQPGGRES
jgi:signal transduction histidine kinase